MVQRFTKFLMSFVALLGVALVAAPAQAVTTVWTFDGTCIDCGPAPVAVTGALTVADYTAGAALTTANFVSFTYSSPILASFEVTSVLSFYGSLNVGASNVGFFTVTGGLPKLFSTSATGSWSLIDPTPLDIGTGATWSIAAVPEPAAWAMMLVGFGAMGMVMRRRHATLPMAI